MAALILQYLPKLLPEVKVSPLPEIIFLSTMKALIVPASHLSATQWSTVASLILLTNTSPALRKATLQLYGYLSLIIGAEIALVNAYVLVCSWISPSTALQPLTVVILNVLNSIIPIFTDSVILFHLVKEKASHTDSRTRLIATTGGPILFKFARLVGAAMYIYASIEFILASFTSGTAPDLAIVEAARVRGIYISSSLHLIDNLYSLGVHWAHAIKMRKFNALRSSLTPISLFSLALSFSSQYILPIVLSSAQLGMTSFMQSSNAATLIDSAKVVINIVSASMTTLRKNLSGPTAHRSSQVRVSSEKAEDLGHNAQVALSGGGVVTTSVRTPTSVVGPATEKPADSVSTASAPHLDLQQDFSPSLGPF